MRFGLQARFIAILLLTGLIAIIAAVALHHQLHVRNRVVSEAVQSLLDRGGAQQANDEQQQGAITVRIEAAEHHYVVEVTIILVVLGGMLVGIALLVSHGLVQPILRLAEVARKIEAGDEIAPLQDSQRDDEIGDLACAFGTLNDALVAMRRRMDHDAAQVQVQAPATAPAQAQAQAPRVSGTMVFSPAKVAGKDAEKTKPSKPFRPAVAASLPPSPRALERLQRLEDDLRHAWQRGEMNVVYQPIHSLADGGMRGAEALLRWQHRIDGAIEPSEFIPLAERSDLIVELGRNVLVQACSDASLWPSGGTVETTPFLSVNVSARQLQDPHLFESVVDALRRSGMAAARLHLEMPVAALRDGDSTAMAMIEQLRGLGVQIWLDATGADASDQPRWLKSQVDGVKVGRSRIAGKDSDAADEASIVASARALRIVAVVVGVEELAQLNVLREQGAELAQGYVLCKPVSTAEIGRRLLA
ncbi:MAG TPA: EAL domain-containing protein [Xanthomonadaceae bacterium]|nr:EAL domain-containing protein [Xanthomonadaceae bacterium]